jgi:hypothetical protein
MSQNNLTTDEIIQQAKSLTKVIKDTETEVATLEGKRGSLYERLEKELGFEDTDQARSAMKDKEDQLHKCVDLIRSKWTELKGRPEWSIIIRKSTNDS